MEKLSDEARKVGASNNKPHLKNVLANETIAGTRNSSKFTAETTPSVLQEKDSERRTGMASSATFAEKRPFQNTSAAVALFARPTYKKSSNQN